SKTLPPRFALFTRAYTFQAFEECLCRLQSPDECSAVLCVLKVTAILERCLGDVLFSRHVPVPFLLKDILTQPELSAVFGTELMLVLQIVMGSPRSLNLRNVVWHGFVTPREVDRRFVNELLSRTTVALPLSATVERETDGVLPFLDVSVKRASDALNFAVYRKPTHTGRYLDFESYHPTSHKASVVSALFRRALSVCSTEEALREEVKKVKADLVNNGYPKRFINDIYKRPRRPPGTPASRPSNRICLPYVKNVSETVGRVLRKHGIAVSHKPVSTIRRRLPLPKDRPGRERAQGLVYRVPCADCPVAYVGETKNFPDRIRRHKYDVKKKDTEASTLAEHEQKTGHSFSLDETQIVATERHWRKRLHLESWFIQTTSKNANRSKGTLPGAYVSGLRALWGVGFDEQSFLSVLEASPLVLPGRMPFWHSCVQLYNESRYDESLVLVLPQVECILRVLFTVANDCPWRLLTAEMSTLYTTLDEEIYLDLFAYLEGPRLRVRISHGEADLSSIRKPLLIHLFNTVAATCANSLCENHKLQKCSTLGSLRSVAVSYHSHFHPIQLLRKKVLNTIEALKSWEEFIVQEKLGDSSVHCDPLGEPAKHCILLLMSKFDIRLPVQLRTEATPGTLVADLSPRTVFRPRRELEVTTMLRQVCQEAHRSLRQVHETLAERTERWRLHQLRSRQRDNYKRLLE
ncbi:hypothetical protein HPB47_005082, partial [Ixodes persulcatus]